LAETGRRIRGFTPAAMDKMVHYGWPGNVRELRNVVERAVALSTGAFIDASDIWLSNLDVAPRGVHQGDEKTRTYQPQTLEEMEREFIYETLRFTSWNKSQAAKILGIERSTLDRKIKSYDLKR
jgi:Nif-specific regulatory protein